MTNQYPDVLSILEAVSNVSGKLDKVAILEANKDNADLKTVFYLALNGLISFYVKKLPVATEHASLMCLSEGLSALNALSSRIYTGNRAQVYIQNLLEKLSERDAEVVRRVLGRDLRIGAGDGSADKVWPGMIPRFAVSLCTSYSDKALAKIKYPAYAQLKADGSRTQALIDLHLKVVSFWTRAGKEVFLSKKIAQKVLDLFPAEWAEKDSGKSYWVLDGEIVALAAGGVVDRATGNGLYNKAIKDTITEAEEDQLNFQVWDLIPYSEWQKGKGTQPYTERLAALMQLNHGDFTTVIETHIVNSLAEAKAIYIKYIEQDLEGIILKNFAGVWEDARSKDQVKFKQELLADLEIIEVVLGKEGKKYAEVAGTLRCKTSCGMLVVDASGMTDAQRLHFWNKRDELIGMIVEIKYNGIVKRRGTENYSLFLPRFIKFRDDKTVANTLDELQESKSEASL